MNAITANVLNTTITQPCQRFCYHHLTSAVYLVRYQEPINKMYMAKPTCAKCLHDFCKELLARAITYEVAEIKYLSPYIKNFRNGPENGKKQTIQALAE